MIKIHFTRDSVGVEDMGASNCLDLEFDNDAKWNEIIPRIKNEQFLPMVPGNDAVWTLENNKKCGILSFFTLDERVLRGTHLNDLASICDHTNYEMHFKYYPTRKERADDIYRINGFSKYCMWHDGWLVEWELCQN